MSAVFLNLSDFPRSVGYIVIIKENIVEHHNHWQIYSGLG